MAQALGRIPWMTFFFFRSQKPAKRRGCFRMNLLGIEVDMALIVLGCVFGVLVIIHAAGLVHTSRSWWTTWNSLTLKMDPFLRTFLALVHLKKTQKGALNGVTKSKISPRNRHCVLRWHKLEANFCFQILLCVLGNGLDGLFHVRRCNDLDFDLSWCSHDVQAPLLWGRLKYQKNNLQPLRGPQGLRRSFVTVLTLRNGSWIEISTWQLLLNFLWWWKRDQWFNGW